MNFFFKQILKVSAFCLEKQRSFIPKRFFLSRCQYQNKEALFTNPIFSEGFGVDYRYTLFYVIVYNHAENDKQCAGFSTTETDVYQ